MSIHRLEELALAAAVVLSACAGGEGAQERRLLEERSLLEYIPEVLRPTCVNGYELSDEDCLFSCPDFVDIAGFYPGAVAGLACRYKNADVRYLRYRTVTSLHAALRDKWGIDAEGCSENPAVLPGREYRYRVGGGPVGGLFRFNGEVSHGHAWWGGYAATWTDDRALVLADAMLDLGEAAPGNNWWQALVTRSVELEAGTPRPRVDLQLVSRGDEACVKRTSGPDR